MEKDNRKREWRDNEIGERGMCTCHGRCVNLYQKNIICGVH
jgi:hypothetical protein